MAMSGGGNSTDRALDFLTKIRHNLTALYTHFCSVGDRCYVLVDKGGRNANLTTELCLMLNCIFISHHYIYIYIVLFPDQHPDLAAKTYGLDSKSSGFNSLLGSRISYGYRGVYQYVHKKNTGQLNKLGQFRCCHVLSGLVLYRS
jgi:hypothetical protein